MSLANLEQYQETGRRYVQGEVNKPTLEQQKKYKAECMERRKVKVKAKNPTKHFNHLCKSIPVDQITPEIEEKEEQWGIDHLDYLID